MTAPDVDPWGRSERTRAVVRRLYSPIYRYWFRTRLEGPENIPATGGALLVANHAGALPVDASLLVHGIETAIGFHVGCLAGQLLILDLTPKPGRIVPGAQMMLPGAVVQAVGNLPEQHQILDAKIEDTVWSAKEEAALGPEIALGVFARVTPVHLA